MTARDAGTFAEGWDKDWTVDFQQRRARHLPTDLIVELRHSDAGRWYPFALDAETWLFNDQSRLEVFIALLHQAEVLFHQSVPETGWLPYGGEPALLEGPRKS
jgi:hypothetical protein